MLIPASKVYVRNTAVPRLKHFFKKNKIKSIEELARLDRRRVFYDNRDAYVAMASIARGKKRDLTLSYNSKIKGRVIDINIEPGSMNYITLTAKTSYQIPGFVRNMSIDGGIFEQYRKIMVMPMHSIPAIHAELEALL